MTIEEAREQLREFILDRELILVKKSRRMFSDEQIERICWEIEKVNKEQREKELKSTKEGD